MNQIKNTSELLAWSKKVLDLDIVKETELLRYIGTLEQIIKAQNRKIDQIRVIVEK